jgi:tetratricopeptide (TPR) repeat protein
VADEPVSPTLAAGADADALEALIKDGTRLLAEKNPKMAKPLFEAALSRDPKNPHAQAGLGQALLETGDAAQAQVAFEAAIKLRPKRARYRVQLGDALKAQGKLEEARAAWTKALEVDPADRDAPKRLGK